MLSVADASRTILANIRRLGVEQVPLSQCTGRVLGENIVARAAMPPWDNSSMDGYAVRSADISAATEHNPVTLTVTGDIPAGSFAKRSVSSGEAMRIMTGAPIPAGADCVVRLEDTDSGMQKVAIRIPVAPGRNVRYAGEDFQKESAALLADTALNSAHIGVLAALGVTVVPVYRAPRVAIISSGDELVTLDQYDSVIAGKKIVSSNNYTLSALVAEAGGVPLDLGIAADSVTALREKFEQASDCDLIITSAGVSVGEKDFTREAVSQLGGTQHFWKVRMRPGAPLAFGDLQGIPWLGVSGNPVSAMVSFILFARPVIRKMLGHSLLFPESLSVHAAEEISTSAPLTHFLRGIVSRNGDAYEARLSGSQSSGVMTALARANALLVIPEDVQVIHVGDILRAIPLDGSVHMTESLGF